MEDRTVTVHIATLEDIPAAETLSRKTFSELRQVYHPLPKTVEKQSTQLDDTTPVVARNNNSIVGTLRYYVKADKLCVLGLAVDSFYRRRGIARGLLDFVTEEARRLDLSSVSLRTIRETGNVPIFERMSFRIVNEVVADWCESENHSMLHDVWMEKAVG